MGMDAELLAIGEYHPDVANVLDYLSQFYADTPTGSEIIVLVATCPTTQSSEGLARALGIDPWQFQEHCRLSGENADLELFQDSVESGEQSLFCFLKLRAYGFKFYYRPNG